MTHDRRRRGWVAGVGLVAVLMACATASSAFACVPVRSLLSVAPQSSGPSGTQVTLNGVGFGSGDIEIRWNAPDGPQLAKAAGPDFIVPVTIPDSTEGLYSVIAMVRAKDGGLDNAATAPFFVTVAGGSGLGSRAPSAVSPASTAGSSSKGGVPQLVWTVLLVAIAGVVGVALARRRRRQA